MSRRTQRIASQLRDEISRILREDATDPRIGLVTFTRVDVAPDLSNAVLYYSVMGDRADDDEALASVAGGLASAAPFLRRRAARELSLRRMPELRFRYDPSLSLGNRTLELLREIGPAGGDRVDASADEASRTPRNGSGADDETP